MSVQQKIEQHLEESNYHEALSLYEKHKYSIRAQPVLYIRLAKACFSFTDYDRVLTILDNVPLTSAAIVYEAKVLEFKTNYLKGSRTSSDLLSKLQELVKSQQFEKHHRQAIAEFRRLIDFVEPPKNKKDLKAQGSEFERLLKQPPNLPESMMEGFQEYLISKAWLTQWKKYVYLTEHELERGSPGPITQFEIIDHPFAYVHDPEGRKAYTNRYLLNPADYVMLNKECWEYLASRYANSQILRYNICNMDRPTQCLVEVNLKTFSVSKYEGKKKYMVQISRRDTWSGLQEKLCRAWGTGRLWKSYNSKLFPVGRGTSLEEEESNAYDLVFEVKQGDRWVLQEPNDSIVNCIQCGKKDGLKWCQCRKVKYCNASCQKKHRKQHEKLCQGQLAEVEMSSMIDKYDLGEAVSESGNKGLVGLKNIGNSCYMNTGIQCLSNTKELTKYFLSNNFISELNSTNPLGSSGSIACAYAKLIRDIWTVKNDQISPFEFKKVFSKFKVEFSGFGQHDAQEFITTLVDCLHEDTNQVKKKPVVEEADYDNKEDSVASKLGLDNYAKRNKSYISSLMLGQYKSVVHCPTESCKRVAVTFDTFMLVTLPIPQPFQLEIFFIPRKNECFAQKILLATNSTDSIADLGTAIKKVFEIEDSELAFKEISADFEIIRQFSSKAEAAELARLKTKDGYVFCYEVPAKVKKGKTLYTVNFYYGQDSKKAEKISFPRLFYMDTDAQEEEAEEVIWKALAEFNKNTSITKSRQLFTISMEANNIKVLLRTEIKLRTYKESKKNQEDLNIEEHSLADCIKLFCKDQKLEEHNEWYCNKCKKFVRANKKMDFYKVGKILVLGLKRFKLDRKIKTMVKFPHRLDMGPYVLGKGKESTEYELYAVVNHFGSLYSGHYTAYCKNNVNGRWYQFNDGRVSSIKEDEVVSKNAYVLFYRLID